MTTLADLTPAERAECVGMWATVATERHLAVIVRTYMADDVRIAQMLAPEINDYYTTSLESITPRFDLPRAWQADGQPVPGEWEEGYALLSADGDEPGDPATIEGQITGQLCALDPEEWIEAVTVTRRNEYEIEGKARRWVGEWEPC